MNGNTDTSPIRLSNILDLFREYGQGNNIKEKDWLLNQILIAIEGEADSKRFLKRYLPDCIWLPGNEPEKLIN